ncbi:Rho family GTPase [Blastocystis sp. subtype 4]|uniref:Rho family GTPase n=1 Tax=Blastocystis sp. subtype 4 TaxID=944170 RepID=UPI000711C45D|nr:Rho family GTPase [Blastocystis sp. subtype 4]KNB41637.1 Rho family GTPase [Blastocystis sp. subtype 4]|eukprot:XP_014525080.1 Rho family GTPase [Blastocystis sp. subtype 4]
MADSKPIKCVIVGDGAVGKTCILISYCKDKFPEDYVPTVFDNYQMDLEIKGEIQKFELWDTAGQEDYEQLRPLSYFETDIFLICYSTVDRSSFNNVYKWYDELKSYWKDKSRPLPVMLVGNKTDLITNPTVLRRLAEKKEKVVTMKESQEVAKEIGAFATVQCSAKTQENLKKVFDMAVNYVLEYRYSKENSCCIV